MSEEKKGGRLNVADEAQGLIRGPRKDFYGHPSVNFQRIAQGWNAYLVGRAPIDEQPLTPHDVALLMVILKAVRGAAGYHRDSAVDIVGYAALDAVVSEDDEL